MKGRNGELKAFRTVPIDQVRKVWTLESEGVRPDPEMLRWHNERRFRG